jgi:hypothetical protein
MIKNPASLIWIRQRRHNLISVELLRCAKQSFKKLSIELFIIAAINIDLTMKNIIDSYLAYFINTIQKVYLSGLFAFWGLQK